MPTVAVPTPISGSADGAVLVWGDNRTAQLCAPPSSVPQTTPMPVAHRVTSRAKSGRPRPMALPTAAVTATVTAIPTGTDATLYGIWGADDMIVSDTSSSEIGYLGKIGAVPGWPGDDVHPPQPMVSQTRAVLEKYAANGGAYREVRFEDTGHTPFIEKPERFMQEFLATLAADATPR